MTLEQLNNLLEGTLTEANITALNPLQEAILARIKQGGDAVFVAESGAGKTTGIGLIAVMRAPKAFEGSPRVLILSPTVDTVHVLHQQLTHWTRRTEIAVELGHDKGNMVLERNNIFEGADIIVGNTKRIMSLYNQNGIHMNQLNLFVVDGASEITTDPVMAQHILRLVESLPKCQRIVLTREITPRVEKMIEYLCLNPKITVFEPTEES